MPKKCHELLEWPLIWIKRNFDFFHHRVATFFQDDKRSHKHRDDYHRSTSSKSQKVLFEVSSTTRFSYTMYSMYWGQFHHCVYEQLLRSQIPKSQKSFLK